MLARWRDATLVAHLSPDGVGYGIGWLTLLVVRPLPTNQPQIQRNKSYSNGNMQRVVVKLKTKEYRNMENKAQIQIQIHITYLYRMQQTKMCILMNATFTS